MVNNSGNSEHRSCGEMSETKPVALFKGEKREPLNAGQQPLAS